MNETYPPSESIRFVIGRRLAVVSGLFMLLVSIHMGVTRYQLKTIDPLDSPALKTLMAQLDKALGDELLRQQIRELDLMARRGFFVRQWQFKTGAWMLTGAGLLFVVALQLMRSGRQLRPVVRQGTVQDTPEITAAWARRSLAVSGGVLLTAAVVFALWAGRPGRLNGDHPAGRIRDLVPAACPAPSEGLQNWPSFRGTGGLGVAAEADPPVVWDGASGTGILWKSVIPRPGFNSPVVWGNRVYLSGADASVREVYAFDADTGKPVWTAGTEGVPGVPAELPKVTGDTGYAAPSVAADGRHVVAVFGTGTLLGLDADGRRLWALSLPVPDNNYGHSSSLLLYRDTVYVQYDYFGGSSLIALEAETGRERWRQSREAETSWASPILVEVGGRMVLILSAAPMVAAYDALTGEVLWSNACMRGEIGASPAYAAGRVFAANENARAVAIDVLTGKTLWETTDPDLPDAGSPVATDRFLFLPTSFGVFSCLNAVDGTVVWTHEFDSGGYGSPVIAGDRIYWVTKEGVTRIFKADETFELISEPPLGESSVSTPALVDRRLYVRGETHLFCIGSESP